MYKDIIAALKVAKDNAQSYEQWDGKSRVVIQCGTTKITCKDNKKAIESLLAKYEKNYQHTNFQNKLKWAWNDTRNFKQKALKNPSDSGFSEI
jgi:hypothetical protein